MGQSGWICNPCPISTLPCPSAPSTPIPPFPSLQMSPCPISALPPAPSSPQPLALPHPCLILPLHIPCLTPYQPLLNLTGLSPNTPTRMFRSVMEMYFFTIDNVHVPSCAILLETLPYLFILSLFTDFSENHFGKT